MNAHPSGAGPGKIRCAVVGLGRIGSLLEDDALREKPCTHAGAVAANPRCLLAGGADIDPRRRRLFAERWNLPEVFADCREMIRAVRPRILHIATHPDSHEQYVRLAADEGVPVAVCEKPLAHTLASARRIAALHRSGAVTVLVNHERRYSADYLLAGARIREMRHGRLLSATGRLYFGRTRKLMDQMIHDGTHLADILAFLTGGPLKKVLVFGRMDRKSGTAVVVAKSGSIPVTIEVGAEREHLVFEVDLSFQRGRIRVGNGLYEEHESRESPHYEGFRSLAPTGVGPPERTGYFAGMLEDAVACALDPARRPRSDAADGLAALRFILSVVRRS